MKLIRKDQAIHVDKTNGTEVDYYLLDDAEIHYNKINPHTSQEWHRHRHISENIFVLKGELVYRYLDKTNKEQYLKLKQGNLLLVEKDIHTFENQTDEDEMGFSYDDLEKFINGEKLDKNIEEKIKKMVKISEHKRNFAKGFRR